MAPSEPFVPLVRAITIHVVETPRSCIPRCIDSVDQTQGSGLDRWEPESE